MKNARECFGKRMAIARSNKRLSVTKLAEMAGVNNHSLYSYETGRTMPAVDIAYKVAKVLGVTLEWLCGEGALEEGLDEQ